MKKTLIALQVVIFLMVGIKIAAVGQLFDWNAGMRGITLVRPAVAGPNPQGIRPSTGGVLDNGLQKERDLYAILEKKRAELDTREAAMNQEEQKLAALKKEIQDRIDQLALIEKRLETKLDAEKSADAKRFKDLAKIYEAAAPAKAGAMLERLDTKTAAGITLNMKRDKAGVILSNVNVQKVVEITKEITQNLKGSPEKP
jgi:flagellar motility protein MotE (MotC chaperone)